MSSTVTIFRARRVLTMNPARPEATHVAVRDGLILGVGTLDELRGWGPFELDERLADRGLMPGLVEAHSHLSAGGFWRYAYCGWFDAPTPTATSGRVRSRSTPWWPRCSAWPTARPATPR